MNNTEISTVANITADVNQLPNNITPQLIAITCMLSIFFVVGTIGNALAFIIYYRKREKGTSTIFIISLTVTDFFTCLFVIPYSIVHEVTRYVYSHDIFCRLYVFLITFNVPLSILILVVIGFDRYFCICHPFLHVITVPRAKKIIFVLTVISILLGVVPLMAHSIYYVDFITENVTVPIDSASYFLTNRTAMSEVSSMSPMMVTASPAVDYITKVSTSFSEGPSSTSQIFTDGLFLNPDSKFLDEMENDNKISYKTGYSTSDFSTSPFAEEAKLETNHTIYYIIKQVNRSTIINYGRCVMTTITISAEFVKVYQRFYASLFLVEFIIIALLYALIYRSILVRRSWKAKRKSESYSAPSCVDGEETQLTNINGNSTEVTTVVKKNSSRISAAMRDRTLYANIRTAAMLFVVTVVFVVSFLPSWLMGLKVINMNLLVFYTYFFNNVANPIIYAFMNRTFRDELVILIKNCVCRR